MADGQWWYNTATKTVEPDDKAGKAVDRLGPYATRDEAEHAMDKVAERNDSWDHDDKWNDD